MSMNEKKNLLFRSESSVTWIVTFWPFHICKKEKSKRPFTCNHWLKLDYSHSMKNETVIPKNGLVHATVKSNISFYRLALKYILC